MTLLFAFIAGLLFGLGLILSGMTNPDNIQNFLDIAGHWDPSLLFVMVGAIVVSAITFFWVKSRSISLLGEPLHLPTNTTIDRKLILGASLFGIGWGLVGFCPGPAIAAIITQTQEAGLFVISMIVGMLGFKLSKKSPL